MRGAISLACTLSPIVPLSTMTARSQDADSTAGGREGDDKSLKGQPLSISEYFSVARIMLHNIYPHNQYLNSCNNSFSSMCWWARVTLLLAAELIPVGGLHFLI